MCRCRWLALACLCLSSSLTAADPSAATRNSGAIRAAEALVEQNRVLEALSLLRSHSQAVAANDRQVELAETYSALGYAYAAAGSYGQAVNSYRMALETLARFGGASPETAPFRLQVLERTARLTDELGDVVGALALYRAGERYARGRGMTHEAERHATLAAAALARAPTDEATALRLRIEGLELMQRRLRTHGMTPLDREIEPQLADLRRVAAQFARWCPAEPMTALKAGLITCFEGALQIDGEPLKLRPDRYPEVAAGEILRVEGAFFEMSLGGSRFLRTADAAEVEAVATDLEHVRLRLRSGAVVIDWNDSSVRGDVIIEAPGGEVRFSRPGIWRTSVDGSGALSVETRRGRALARSVAGERRLKSGSVWSEAGQVARLEKRPPDESDRWNEARRRVLEPQPLQTPEPPRAEDLFDAWRPILAEPESVEGDSFDR